MLIGQHCSCILNRCAFWSTPILHQSGTVSSVSLICSVYLFLVGLCLISSNNQEILSLLIVVLYANWTLDYLIGFLESDWGVVATCPAPLERVWWVKTGQTSLQRFVSALEEIIRICEEYACDSVKSCSCRGAGAPLDRKEKHREANSLVTCSWVSLLFPISGSLYLCHSVQSTYTLPKI